MTLAILQRSPDTFAWWEQMLGYYVIALVVLLCWLCWRLN